jgi:aspartate/methionine/tyrosine aminotransferase
MNTLAVELNKTLKETVIFRLLSDFGKRCYFPKGIVSQSAEAKKYATRFNATVGMATLGGKPMHLNSLKVLIPDLPPEQIFSYAPTPGNPQLRKLWLDDMIRKNPSLAGQDTSLPLVVSGLTHGISVLADLFTGPGDCVLGPDMFWGNYSLIFEQRNRASISTFPFFNPQAGLNIEGLKDALNMVTGGKVILMLNFPNNPTGYSPTEWEARALVQLLKEQAQKGLNILCVVDDAYFGLFYEKETHKESLFASLASLHENILAVKVDGATKEELVWGFRVGFLTFASPNIKTGEYDALISKVMGAVRASISNSNNLTQNLLLRAMQSPDHIEEKKAALAILKERYLKVREIVERLSPGSKLEPLPFNSGYFMTFRLGGSGTEKLRKKLLMEQGIGTISIQDKYLRVAYSSVDLHHLEELFKIIFKTAEESSS